MRKINIQISLSETIEYSRSFILTPDSNLTEEEIVELYKHVLNKVNKKLENKQITKQIQTIVRPYNIVFKIDGVKYRLEHFKDALILIFKYIVDNDLIKQQPQLKFGKNRIIYDTKSFSLQYKHYVYKGYYLDQYFTRQRMIKVINLIIKTFKLENKIKIKNWPK
jgi:hypothetical protein